MRKIDSNKAVIVLSRENKLQGNLQFVFLELKKNYKNIDISFVKAENRMNLRMFWELWIICNAKYIILDDYYLPIYLIKPNVKTKVIQLWHAAGAFKKFGYSTIGTNFGPDTSYLKLVPIHSNYTHVYVSSENIIPFYAEAFNMNPTKIFGMGIPRIDLFFDKQLMENTKKSIINKYPRLDNDSVINVLIAPTYRATGPQEESEFNFFEAINEIASQLVTNIQILIKAHPYTEEKELKLIERLPNVLIINDDFTLNDWMLISDVFITDYSSAIFEFSILQKPMAHYVPDLEKYVKNRGLYNNLNEISDATILMEINELLNWINSRYKNESFDTATMLNYNFESTERVTSKIVRHFIR